MATGYAGWTSRNAADFRNAIHLVARMAQAPTAGDDLTFHWDPAVSTAATKSGDGVPFDPHATVTVTPRSGVQVPYLLEYVDAAGEPTTFGVVVPSRLRLWLLDVDYAAVADADYVTVKGDRYNHDHEIPPAGLFDVELHCCYYTAVNET